MLSNVWKEFQEIDTSRKALRSFGLVVGGVFLSIAAFICWKNEWVITTAVKWLGGIGSVLVLGGLIIPRSLKYPYRLWMGLAVILGYIMTRVLLTLVFYLAVTPIGLIRRLMGKDPLRRKWEPEASTYWLDKTYDDDSPKRLERYY